MKKLAIHYGLPHMINNSNQAFESAEILNDFDEIVLANPLGYEPIDKANYFSVVNLIEKPVWVYTNASSIVITPLNNYNDELNAGIQSMGTLFTNIRNLFDYVLKSVQKLKGFFVDCFGFDWTLAKGNSRVHINRDYQNGILNYIHTQVRQNEFYKAFVNVYFVDDILKPFYSSVYDGYPYWNNYSIGAPALQTTLTTEDYILIENPFIDPQTEKFNLARLKYIYQVMKSYSQYRYCAINEINLVNRVSRSGIDMKIVDEEVEKMLYDYLDLMCSLGIYAAGFADINYGATSNILVDWDYEFENPYGIPDDMDIEKDNETGDIWITLRYLRYDKEKRFHFKEKVSRTYRVGSFG